MSMPGKNRAAETREGIADVGGTSLAYRLTGHSSSLPTLVFENGWSASYHQWTLLQPHLAPHTQLLFYDRAGIGGSRVPRTSGAKSISDDLAGLCATLGIDGGIVVVGQSYGGLIAGLHGALVPSLVKGMVQLDSTPELDDAEIDRQLRLFRKLGVLSVWVARLRLRNPLFAPLWEHFPEREAHLVETLCYRSPESLKAAVGELDLLRGIRREIGRNVAQRRQPRLIVSAGAPSEPKSWLARRLNNPAQLRKIIEQMQSLHRRQSAHGENGRWEVAQAHTHGGLVSTPDGAAFSARRVLAFLQEISA